MKKAKKLGVHSDSVIRNPPSVILCENFLFEKVADVFEIFGDFSSKRRILPRNKKNPLYSMF